MGQPLRLYLVIGCLLCFASAFGGALLALAIDQPDVIVTERTVEGLPSGPDLSPTLEDLAALRASYIELAGVEDDDATAVVEEIAAAVCTDPDRPVAEYAGDVLSDPAIGLTRPELLEFMTEVRLACRTG